jgi:uncharacterized protein (TIGR04255 family)
VFPVPFRPIHDRHAIQEVVFVLTLGRGLEAGELGTVVKAHDRWRNDLPRLTRFGAHQIQEITLTDDGPPQIKPVEQPGVVGIAFDALKRDGSLDWRLRLQENWIGVNCLSYTRWSDVWPTARNFLAQVGEIIINPKLPIVGMALQYIDLFVWDGDTEQYRADGLFRKGSEYIPSSIWNRGPLWHLYQGWFTEENLPVAGRRLEKVHIDAVEGGGVYQTKVDTTSRHDLADELPSYKTAFGTDGEEACIDAVFTAMHLQGNRLLKAYITDEMARRISLDE